MPSWKTTGSPSLGLPLRQSFALKPSNESTGIKAEATRWWSFQGLSMSTYVTGAKSTMLVLFPHPWSTDGILTGRYFGRQCVRDEKVQRVREMFDLSTYDRIYAYGDTQEDLELLAIAHERYYQWRLMPL